MTDDPRPDRGAQSPGADVLLPIRRDGKWGFVDSGGAIVIEPRFDNVRSYNEGLACVMVRASAEFVGGKWGYVDRDGVWAVKPQFDEATPFADGRAAVNLGAAPILVPRDPVPVPMGGLYYRGSHVMGGGKWGYIDPDGWVIEPQYDGATSFEDGLAIACPHRRCGFIDRDGRWVVPARFDIAYPFSEGLAAVQRGWLSKRWSYIDRTGAKVLSSPFRIAHSFSEGLAVGVGEELVYGYMNHDGEIVLRAPADVDVARSFSEGLAPVRRGDARSPAEPHAPAAESGTASGAEAEPGTTSAVGAAPGTSSAGPVAATAGLWGFMDRAGDVVIEPRFRAVRGFSEGRAAVRDEHDRWGFIDTSGKLVILCQWETVSDFRDGRAHVWSSPRDTRYIDTQGRVMF